MNLLVAVLLLLLAVASTLSAGLELEVSSSRRVRAGLGGLLRPLVANLIVVPVVTLGVLSAVRLPPDAVEALLLVSVAPGGASGPLLARLGGGDPTRIGLTYVALVASAALALPCVLPFIAPDARVSVTTLVVALGAQLLPLALGLWLRLRQPRLALLLAPLLRSVGTVLLVSIVVLLVVTRGALLPTLGARTNIAVILVVGASLAAGATLGPRPRLSYAVLAGVRNLTLALSIVEAQRAGGRGTLIVAAYGLFMYIAALTAARVCRADPSTGQGDEQGRTTQPT